MSENIVNELVIDIIEPIIYNNRCTRQVRLSCATQLAHSTVINDSEIAPNRLPSSRVWTDGTWRVPSKSYGTRFEWSLFGLTEGNMTIIATHHAARKHGRNAEAPGRLPFNRKGGISC